MNTWFVTGTDTEIGKTHATCDLLRLLASHGQRAAGLKPIASGCERTPDGLRNDDALALMKAANVHLPYETVNPYAFEPAIAPHIAAAEAGIAIDVSRITDCLRQVDADWCLIEGAGGWNIPLDNQRLLNEMVAGLTTQVLLVVGMRLGCINHALLSAAQIQRDGFELVGWVANEIDPEMSAPLENLSTLEALMPAPCVGKLPYYLSEKQKVSGDWRLDTVRVQQK